MQEKQQKEFVFDSWESLEPQLEPLINKSDNKDESPEARLLYNTQILISLNKLADLSDPQVETNAPYATNYLNKIGLIYNELHEYRWALGFHFLALYKIQLR